MDGLPPSGGSPRFQTRAPREGRTGTAEPQGPGHYDRFRNRLIFPIANLSDRTVGFGARALASDDEPKYLNSPETPIYHKSSVLYGLSSTRDDIRKRDCAIVVEGYMDVLSLVQHEVPNVVASSGTSLTEEHCRTLGRYTHRVVLLFDGDSAGSTAAMRGIEVLLAAGVDAGVVSLPRDHDPDSFVRAEGRASLEAAIEAAEPALDYFLSKLAHQFDLRSLGGRDRAVQAVQPLFARCREPVRLDHLFRRTAERFGIDEKALRQTVQRSLQRGPQRRPEPGEAPSEQLPDPPRTEREFLGLLLLHPELIAPTAQQLEPNDMTDARCCRLARLLFEEHGDTDSLDLSQLMSGVEDESLTQLISLCAMEGFDESHVREQWQDHILRFQKEALTRQIQQSRRELREAVQDSQDGDVSRINAEVAELIRARQSLGTH